MLRNLECLEELCIICVLLCCVVLFRYQSIYIVGTGVIRKVSATELGGGYHNGRHQVGALE